MDDNETKKPCAKIDSIASYERQKSVFVRKCFPNLDTNTFSADELKIFNELPRIQL